MAEQHRVEKYFSYLVLLKCQCLVVGPIALAASRNLLEMHNIRNLLQTHPTRVCIFISVVHLYPHWYLRSMTLIHLFPSLSTLINLILYILVRVLQKFKGFLCMLPFNVFFKRRKNYLFKRKKNLICPIPSMAN